MRVAAHVCPPSPAGSSPVPMTAKPRLSDRFLFIPGTPLAAHHLLAPVETAP